MINQSLKTTISSPSDKLVLIQILRIWSAINIKKMMTRDFVVRVIAVPLKKNALGLSFYRIIREHL
jgi:hypothetical protein